jgi:hypothetical protein
MKCRMPSIAARISRSRFRMDICVVDIVASIDDEPGRYRNACVSLQGEDYRIRFGGSDHCSNKLNTPAIIAMLKSTALHRANPGNLRRKSRTLQY